MTASIEKSSAILVPFDMASKKSLGGSDPLSPIYASGGLVLQYSPTITENIQINYESSGDLVHTNEKYKVYKNTENRVISLTDVVFTADTYENAKYMMAAVHFFRTYSLMDFGAGRSGKPPSPMWFSAYGKFAYDRVPVLFEATDFGWGKDSDMVAVPNPGSNATVPAASNSGDPVNLANFKKTNADNNNEDITWMPTKMTIGTIRLTVQHSPKFWKGFNLDDYKNGAMMTESDSSGILSGTRTNSAALSSSSASASASSASASSASTMADIRKAASKNQGTYKETTPQEYVKLVAGAESAGRVSDKTPRTFPTTPEAANFGTNTEALPDIRKPYDKYRL